MRTVRRWKLLFAHDATASTCDLLIDAIEGALGNVDVNESSSMDDARDAVRTVRFDLAMVCLDLPPAPLGGVRLAQEFLDEGLPVVLVTRSLRWIPPSAAALHELAWVPPDAGAEDVSRAVGEAMASRGGRSRWGDTPQRAAPAQAAESGPRLRSTRPSAPELAPAEPALITARGR
jgi:hypothetical protein